MRQGVMGHGAGGRGQGEGRGGGRGVSERAYRGVRIGGVRIGACAWHERTIPAVVERVQLAVE